MDGINIINIAYEICFSRSKNILKYRNYLLSTWNNEKKRTMFDDMLFPFVFSIFEYLFYVREKDPNIREEMKKLCSDGESCEKWFYIYKNRPLDLDIILYKDLEKRLREESNFIVVQLGSCSGREVAYFAKRFPEHEFIGIELYQPFIDLSNAEYNLPNLSFELMPAVNISILMEKYKDKKFIFFSSGSMEYIQPEHIRGIFTDIKNYGAEIFLYEPIVKKAIDEIKSTYRGNFSFNHNYKYFAEYSGIKTLEMKTLRMEDNEFALNYYYYGIGN